jgi:hypothetical protein
MANLNFTWSDGSSDQVYLSIDGNTITVTSDENTTGTSRTMTLYVVTTDGKVSVPITISQSGGGPMLASDGEPLADINSEEIYVR